MAIKTLTPSIHQDKIFSTRGFCTSNAQNKQSDLIIKSLGVKKLLDIWVIFSSTGQILHIWETDGTDGTDMIDPFKDDFPGHLCRAAFAIPAMFQTFL